MHMVLRESSFLLQADGLNRTAQETVSKRNKLKIARSDKRTDDGGSSEKS